MEYKYEVRQTDVFSEWFQGLRDVRARTRIQFRIDRLELGSFGDCESVGSGVSEMRIHFGPGYRVYFMRRNQAVLLLFAGGSKRTQKRDIAKAIELAEEERS